MGYDMHAVEDGAYFRYNIWGMSDARNKMDAFGMLDFRDHAPWPKAEDFGFDPKEDAFEKALAAYLSGDYEADDELELPEGVTEEDYDRARQLAEAEEAIKESELDPAEGIPAYKLGSNDGWLVTPGEIATALALFEASAAADPASATVPEGVDPETSSLAYFLEFVEFLRHSQAEGFRVH